MGSIEAPQKFKIIVIGAGIAGLTAALGLHQKGHTVTVLERHADTQALGGPINLSPSATHIMTEYGLEELIHERLGLRERPVSLRRFEDGSQLGTTPVGTSKKLYGSGVWTASRFGWQKIFKQVAEERGIKIEFSTPVQTMDVDTATVVLRDGRKLEADLVIAADGAGSVVRPIILGQPLDRRDPVGAINIDVPLDILQDDPELEMLADEAQNFWIGPGGCCAAGPVLDTGVFNMCWISEDKFGRPGEWFIKGDLAGVAERYKDWDPRLVKLVKAAKPENCYIWNITDLPPLPTWSKGRAVLIGDASHATLPYLGMGATSSVEDGRSLAECLDRAKSVGEIPLILKAFESLRKARAESVINMSRVAMGLWHLPDGEQQVQRDAMYAAVFVPKLWDGKPVDDPPTGFADPSFRPYFSGHKTVEFTNRKLDEMGIER
ncbi:3-hydroxybenzoate 6-hydroxylase 1 [Hyphodiscus hymeniophilus]|uniref:3-hydroxybenzoate 6-hydroxylase 1 n=1 Tax=Hyphodiscus hymeniophilus TaxID=353542 RepID=A0A9P6SNK0_9HELO|nr:3-hydroxybenzoate 6-hydroxylase 1 [Hyphodiscus hymeniophilus]